MSIRILHGDTLALLPTLDADSIDAVVIDPPYGLGFMGKDWDSPGGMGDFPMRRTNEANMVNTGVTRQGGRQRSCEDFTKRQLRDARAYGDWCHSWATELYRVMKPGAHLASFGGTRTWQRLSCAIEDAGFEIRDTLAWLYGSGFPKSLDVSKAIDKTAGAERQIVAVGAPVKRMIPGADQNKDGWIKDSGREFIPTETVPSTDAGRQWSGWGTALKPAYEPIILARKPLIGTVVSNVLRHGTGGLNIGDCRVETTDGAMERSGEASQGFRYAEDGATDFAALPGARRGRPLREARRNEQSDLDRVAYATGLAGSKAIGETTLGRWPANVCHDGSDEVLDVFPDAPGQQRSVGPANGAKPSINTFGDFGPRTEFTPRIDSGSAARFFYTAKADKVDRLRSRHPTVKPVDLMRWLTRLVTPPGGTILDCFAGSGTTGMAALAEGFNAVLIEREAEYVADIRRRLQHVSGADTPLFADIAES